jgi:protein-tyrosine phosphatase
VIDLHCHILPALDDGAVDLADSLGMARQAAADGIATVCATPHVRHDHDVRLEQLGQRVAAVQEAIDGEGIPVRVVPGAEVAETAAAGLIEAALRQATLGGAGGWVLLEPAPGPLTDGLRSTARALVARGVRCLIAHPERHLVHDFVERLAALTRDGALVQATAASLLDPATWPGMRTLAERGLIHVLGSDSHSSHAGRPLAIGAAYEPLREVDAVREHVEWMRTTAPEAIVRGEPVAPPF